MIPPIVYLEAACFVTGGVFQKKIDSDKQTSYDYEDLDNWTGWIHALKWCLRMRDGKATRRDAWGRS